LLNFCKFLTLSFCLMLLISLISHVHNNIGFHWELITNYMHQFLNYTTLLHVVIQKVLQ
jgi:hypothetical protein